MSNELQKDDILLKGGLGEVFLASTGKKHTVKQIVANKKDGSVTMTISQVVDHYLNGVPKTEDAECEVLNTKLKP